MVRIVCVTCGVRRNDDGQTIHEDGCSGKYLPHWRYVITDVRK